MSVCPVGSGVSSSSALERRGAEAPSHGRSRRQRSTKVSKVSAFVRFLQSTGAWPALQSRMRLHRFTGPNKSRASPFIDTDDSEKNVMVKRWLKSRPKQQRRSTSKAQCPTQDLSLCAVQRLLFGPEFSVARSALLRLFHAMFTVMTLRMHNVSVKYGAFSLNSV